MIISRTPLRISFAGGGTDLPSFYKKNNYGCVLSASINKYIYVCVKKHSEIFSEKIRLNYSDTEIVNNINKIKNPIIKACLKYLNVRENIYISTVADAPGSSGLGSSSAFCVGLLNALYAYKGINVSKNKLAEEAAMIEIDVLKRLIGKQDHYAASIGSINLFKFHSDEKISVKPVDENSKNVKMMFRNLYTFYSGINRDASKILASQDTREKLNISNLIKIRSQAEYLYQMIYSKNFSLKKFGEFLNYGWQIKKKLSSKISNKNIDDAYNLAIRKGAYGGKLSGAGGGGFLNIVAKKEFKYPLVRSLAKKNYKYFPVELDNTGTIIMTK